jgi:C-terminal processing protease CtpA/Prc
MARRFPLVVLLLLAPTAQAEERNDPALAAPFASTALHTDYSEKLSEAERLAGLALVWSEAKYNFANFDLSPEDLDWDARYLEFIPRVRGAESTETYYRELQRFIAALEDGHSKVRMPQEISQRRSRPPIHTRLIDGKVMIYLVDSKRLLDEGLAIGQEVTHLDGVPVMKFVAERIMPFAAASTEQDRAVRAFTYSLLGGDKDTPVRITTLDARGVSRELEVARSGYLDDDDVKPFPGSFSWRWVAEGVALIDVRTFNDKAVLEQFNEALPELMLADAWIFDIRLNGGGNSGIGFGMIDALTAAEYPVFAWRTRIYRPTYRAWGREEAWAWHDAGGQTWTPEAGPKFDGKVAVLTSARTYSAAEDFTIAFRQVERGPVIGQTTGGSTGQPLFQRLPGGGGFQVCTKRDTAGDGTEWIGVGIRPDIEVTPTVASLRAGEDPVLERAIAEVTPEGAAP